MAVRSFLHYALEVPDQTVGQRFYEDFGLVDGTERGDAVRLRPARLGRESVLLYGGARKRLHHLCYGAPGPDFARVRESLQRAGVRETDAPPGAPEGGIWIRDPDGNAVNVRDEAAPEAPGEAPLTLNGPGYVQREAARGYPERGLRVAPRRHPERFGFAVSHSPDPAPELAALGYNLMVFGHTHGGQVRMPFVGALVTNSHVPRRMASGLVRLGDAYAHISPGLGTSKYAPFRFLCRPEATLLELRRR